MIHPLGAGESGPRLFKFLKEISYEKNMVFITGVILWDKDPMFLPILEDLRFKKCQSRSQMNLFLKNKTFFS